MGSLAILKKYSRGLFTTLKMLHSKDSSFYYTVLGDYVVETLNGNFEDMSKPLWLNLGY